MQKWEYKIVTFTISDRWSAKAQRAELERLAEGLATAGTDGWELIQYVPVPVTGAWSDKIKSYAYLMFFKRPIAE